MEEASQDDPNRQNNLILLAGHLLNGLRGGRTGLSRQNGFTEESLRRCLELSGVPPDPLPATPAARQAVIQDIANGTIDACHFLKGLRNNLEAMLDGEMPDRVAALPVPDNIDAQGGEAVTSDLSSTNVGYNLSDDRPDLPHHVSTLTEYLAILAGRPPAAAAAVAPGPLALNPPAAAAPPSAAFAQLEDSQDDEQRASAAPPVPSASAANAQPANLKADDDTPDDEQKAPASNKREPEDDDSEQKGASAKKAKTDK